MLSKFNIESGLRHSLPIENGFMKFVDLDRCYSVSRITVENGKELVLYTLHLSAYTSDGTIATDQLKMLISDMQAEYEKGNYCIAGGDFNKDLLGDSGKIFGIDGTNYTWAHPVDSKLFDGTNPDKRCCYTGKRGAVLCHCGCGQQRRSASAQCQL